MEMERVRARMKELEEENERLRERVRVLELGRGGNGSGLSSALVSAPAAPPTKEEPPNPNPNPNPTSAFPPNPRYPLPPDEYTRYSRQMLVPALGLPGQLLLRASSILIIGAGGLGCPAAAYLSGAGIGTLGIVDADTVELSNLHRQIAHTNNSIGQGKVESLSKFCKERNEGVRVREYCEYLGVGNVLRIIGQGGWDVVLDCTDNPATRYLVSDACVALGKPLVSASALRAGGQLLVLNCPEGVGEGRAACYRCVWPVPPPREMVGSCGEAGILGPVVGVMGVLMALEAIKIILKLKKTASPAPAPPPLTPPTPTPTTTTTTAAPPKPIKNKTTLLLFSALDHPQFRTLTVRGKNPLCSACSSENKLLLLTKFTDAAAGKLDPGVEDEYVTFCGGGGGGVLRKEEMLEEEERVDVTVLAEILSRKQFRAEEKKGKKHLLIDVREEVEYGICKLENENPSATMINIPITTFERSLSTKRSQQQQQQQLIAPEWLPTDHTTPIYIICKQGNDSQRAVTKLKEWVAVNRAGVPGVTQEGEGTKEEAEEEEEEEEERRGLGYKWAGGIWDIKGGLNSWRREVDGGLPWY